MLHIKAFIDGAAKGNPGPAGAGVLLLDANDDQEILRLSVPLGERTNNFAEYSALIVALEKAVELGTNKIDIYSDSQLLVKQMRGEYKVKNHAIAKFVVRAYELLAKFDTYNFIHIPREHNKIADHLASLAAVANSG